MDRVAFVPLFSKGMAGARPSRGGLCASLCKMRLPCDAAASLEQPTLLPCHA